MDTSSAAASTSPPIAPRLVLFLFLGLLSSCSTGLKGETELSRQYNTESFTGDKSIAGFVMLREDGYMLFTPNRASRRDDPQEAYAPDSDNYKFYYSALSGLAQGQIKPVPEAAGHAVLRDDQSIVITRYPQAVSGQPVLAPTTSVIRSDSPSYAALRNEYKLKSIGDGYIIRRGGN